MLDRAPFLAKIPLRDIEEIATLWLRACQRRCQSPRTLEGRTDFAQKFLWFLGHRGFASVGEDEIEDFVHYLHTGHTEPGGRWGNPLMTRPLRPVSVCDYYRSCRNLFRWALQKGFIQTTPFERIEPPVARAEKKRALSVEDIERLLASARRN